MLLAFGKSKTSEMRLAEQLLMRADRLQPDNPAWADVLGQHLARQARLGPAFGGGPDTLKRALGYFEKSLAHTTDVEWRMGRRPSRRFGCWCSAMLGRMKLYNYFRSSASFRVRIALKLKGLPYDYVPVHLPKGEHKQQAYAAVSADQLVPMLETDEGQHLSQSMAIIEYLDETHPEPALLPADALGRARVRALAQSIACEIHPLNNLRVLKYLVRELGVNDEAKNNWYRHWVRTGLEAFERQLAGLPAATYCYSDTPSLADCCLVPQIFNGQRFDVNFDGLPRTMAAFEACMKLEAFQQAQPSACPDNEA